jgi:T4 RnlA family RNA ligase
VTDVSKAAWDFFMNGMSDELKGNYLRYIQRKVKDGFTVIFEYIAPTNQIVIRYDRPQLILTAVRSNTMGIYQMYTFMVEDAKTYGIPVVQRVASEHSSIADLADHVKDFIGSEGVVVRFADGHMVKMKGLDYVQKHKALDGLRWEKDVLVLIFNGQLDDVLPLVGEDVRSRLVQYRDDVLSNVKVFDKSIRALADQLKAQYGNDRKTYREEAMKHKRSDILMSLLGPKNRPENFKPFDLIVYIAGDKWNISCLRTQETVDEIRDIIGPKSWYEYGAVINTGDA